MYAVTFYSFKGGVGRTFALVNVGIELARAGRKVLLVDFDLEAPGIHTFDALRPNSPQAGVVEFVSDYWETGIAPDVRQYTYEACGVADRGGRVWIMPAGRGDDAYRRRVTTINWQELYRDRDGYVFFEDLKAQWNNEFAPDYVLIDSRTGHTDIEGICTRHLPDAVVILFFPNAQNLAGLTQVVADIKAESTRSRRNRKPVTLHYVMSNVPDLDDEEGILRRQLDEFRRDLGWESLRTIHSYPSLALLNQTIFARERGRSRLAREYRRLKDDIVRCNDEDPEGACRFLRDIGTPDVEFSRRLRGIGAIERRLQGIEEKHGSSGEVMFLLGILRRNQANLEDAIVLFDKAIGAGYRVGATLVERATCYSLLGKHQESARDAKEALKEPGLDRYYGGRAEQLLARIRNPLMLKLIELGQFRGALDALSETRPNAGSVGLRDAFNYAMAEWALTGNVPRDMFARVVELDKIRDENIPVPEANYRQCLAVAHWATGDREAALASIVKSEQLVKKTETPEFSCWRYRDVPPEMFLDDCSAIRVLIATDNGLPVFFSAGRSSAHAAQEGEV